MSVKIITPYVFDREIIEHKQQFWEYDIYYEQDTARIGCDLMFQKMLFEKDIELGRTTFRNSMLQFGHF